MEEICISVAAKVAELLVDPIGWQISYAFKYQRNMEELKKQVKKLTNRRESVQNDVDEAKRQGEEIKKEVQDWLDSVDEFVKKVFKSFIDDQVKVQKLTHERESVQHSVDEAKKLGDEIGKQVRKWLNSAVVKPITDDSVKAKKLCSIGFCHNLKTRYSLSKKAVKTAKDGVDLLGEVNFGKVSNRLPPRRTNSLYIKGFEDFASRRSLSEHIMEALAATDTDLIGVYGMGGVGKTTLVQKVAQKAKENKLFDLVVSAVVTETPDIKKIQDQIAKELGLEFRQENDYGRADQLHNRMKKDNKILVILDNVWKKLDLVSIGIPIVGDEKGSIRQKVDQEEGENANKRQCKIVFTSRNLDVLRDMGTQENFKVENLCNAEGESLFWKTVGCLEEKSDLNPIAVEIVGKCGGLPVAIKTIANALKNKSLPSWKTARDQLKKANPKTIRGMNEDVYSTIELSFNFLEGEEAKSLFLLCSLCNGGYGVHIHDLLNYGMGLSLFPDVDTLEQGWNMLHSLIDDLKNSCMLMDHDYDSNYVKMHDVIHAVALSISSTTKLWFNLRDDAAGLKERLEKKLSKDSVAVSLLYRDIYELPEKMEFPKLELFLLFSKHASLQIPDTVFEGMKGLKVLDISGVHLMSPPSSLRCLINLHTLCLDRCRLKDVAIVCELKELEILSLLNSDIEQLPREIVQLTRLRSLNLSKCSKLKIIKPNVISSLTRLEELYMRDSFDQWDIEGQRNASLAELKQLSNLTALDINVPNAKIIPEGLSFEKLERYRIFVGEVWDWSGKYETSRMLKLSSSIYLSNEIKSLLNRTEDVHLDKLKGVKNVVYELNGEGFPQLKHLHVQNGSEIQHIANLFGYGLCNVFPRLESLFLDNLINLEKICHGPLATNSFSKLRIMKVRKCDRLKHLFSFSMVNNLLQLQEIEVTNCKKLEEIISKENMELVHQNESIRRIEFTQLHTLTLECLPQLTSFSFNASTPDIGSQEIIAEDEADGFMSLFSQNVVLPSLKNLKLSSINIRCTRLDQLPVISSCCRALTNLTLEECNGLKFLFSYSVVQSLVQLQKLEVRNCKSIEEIINTEELRGEKKMIMMVFPKLLNLQLKGLAKLARFSSGNSVEFLSLTQISIEDCPKLKTFFSCSKYADIKQSKENEEMTCQDDIYPLFNEKVELPTLASLYLSSIVSQTIWHNQLQAHSACFHNLTELTVDGCHNLKYLFPISVAECLDHLEVLKILNCKLMEGVITTQGERKSSTLFPKLKDLNLYHLPELTRFCNFNGNSIELPSLSERSIKECPKMQTFASNSLPGIEDPEEVNTDTEENLPSFFDEKVSLSCLKKLKLRGLPRLCLLKENSQPSKVFENLESLEVTSCSNLKTLVPSSVSLQNLETLEVQNCDGLISLVTFSTAKSLEQLKRMEIIGCKLIEEIIIDTGDEIKDGIVFNQLEYLKLRGLPSLTSFCKGNFTIEFPYLQRVLVIECLKMMNFSQGVLSTPKLQSLQMTESFSEEDEGCWEGDLNTTVQKVFRDMDGFRYIEKFTVSDFPHLKELWHEKLLASYFSNLKSLVVDDKYCSLRYIFTPSLAMGLAQLQDLEIKNCVILEVITVIGEETISNTMFPNLNSLKLINLPNLTCFCNFAENSIELPSLTILSIENCPNMETFISNFLGVDMSTSKDNCHTDIQPLFDEKVELPTLATLYLRSIASQTIWHNQLQAHSACFHNLKELTVYRCDNLKHLFPFSVAESLNNLEVLDIWNCKLMEWVITTQGERKSSTLFPKLKELNLVGLPRLTRFYNFNGNSIELPSLSELTIYYCCKMQTFASNSLPGIEEPEEVNTDTEENLPSFFDEKVSFSCLKKLTLDYLPELLHLWKKNSQPSKVFENLKSLDVSGCSNLKTLVPSSVSLQNLETLKVRKCDGLISLVTFSTAKSLEQLKRMKIINCKLIEEIIIDTGDEIKDGIVFNQLKYLKLGDLPSLTSFCKGNFTIEFPYLQRVFVIKCLKLMNFSQGVLSTPKLQSLQMTEIIDEEDKGCWEGDLNTTIQKLFRDKI